MNIKGIGTDIVKNKRVTDKIAQRFLTNKELEVYNSLPKKLKNTFASGRWAAKEALIKASNKKFKPSDISILNEKGGKPVVYIKDKLTSINVSISHEKRYTIAFVVL